MAAKLAGYGLFNNLTVGLGKQQHPAFRLSLPLLTARSLPPSHVTSRSHDQVLMSPLESPMRSSLAMSALESLPEEIKRLLLRSLPSGSALHALVHASPSYHASYLCQRQLTLSCVLRNELLPACLVTAYTVQEVSKLPEQGFEDTWFARRPLIERFLLQRSMHPIEEQLHEMCLETTISIFQRHRTIWQLASRYFAEKLSINPISGKAVHSYEPPSRDEIHRLCRALYHFQLYCFLFVCNRLSKNGPSRVQSVGINGGIYGLSQRFLPNLGKWEVEEIACIREYLFDCYTGIWQSCAGELLRLQDHCIQIKEDAYPENPTTWGAPFEDQKKEFWMSLGLEFFLHISQARSVEAQARMLLENPWRREHFLSRALKGQCWGLGRVCAAHPFGHNHEESEFNGTAVNAGPWLSISNFGLVGQGKDRLRSWGYVIWDRQRIDNWKAVAAEAVAEVGVDEGVRRSGSPRVNLLP